jgi:hypothetical protein
MAPRVPSEDIQDAPEDDEEVGSQEGGDEENDGQENEGDDGQEDEVGRPEADFSTGRPKQPKQAANLDIGRDDEARRERERAERAERELQELRQQRQESRETPEQEAARLALMLPEDRMEYRLNKATQGFQQTARALELRAADASDRASFTAQYAAKPSFAKYADRVEATLQTARQRGGNPDRETVLKYLLGEDAMKNMDKAKETQRRQGQQNIQRQTTRASSGRGDIQPQRRGALTDAQKRAQRLEGVNLLDI